MQGRSVRRNTPRLPEAPGPREGGSGELRLLVAGDSSAAGVGAATFDESLMGRLVAELGGEARVTWRLEAKTRRTTAQVRDSIAGVEGRFDVALTAFGVNDVTSQLLPWEWIQTVGEVVADLRERVGVEHVVLTGVPPMGRFPALPQPLRWYLGRRAREFDEALVRYAEPLRHATWLSPVESEELGDMASDGFHPGPKTYAQWAARAAGVIRSRLPGAALGGAGGS